MIEKCTDCTEDIICERCCKDSEKAVFYGWASCKIPDVYIEGKCVRVPFDNIKNIDVYENKETEDN